MPAIQISFDEEAVKHSLEDRIKGIVDKALTVETQKEVAGEYAVAVAKYVPYGPNYKGHRGGKLLRSAKIVETGEGVAVEYSATSPEGYNYAKLQYETPFENRHTPNTYDHWNRHLTASERRAFYERCAEIISESINNG